MTETIKTLREALQSAAAAIWDKHYGRGLTEAYARGVHEELQNALAALSRLEAEQNRAYPVGCCTSCAVMHPEFHGHKAGCPQDVTAAPGSSTSEPTPPVCNCEACRLLRTEGVPTPCERLAAEYATPPVECPIRAVATEMIDALDNATEADEWSTSELRAAVASPCPPCQKCDSADSLIADSRRLQKIEAAARALVDAMETCHICEGTLHLDEGPVHCENCSGDCEDHEGPECVPLYRLHWTLKRALKDCCGAGAVEEAK